MGKKPSDNALRAQLWYEFCRSTLTIPLLLGFRIRYFGQRNIPAEGGFLLVSNHQSHLDPPLLGYGCWRQLNYVARETLFHVPILRPLIRSLKAIPIDRDGMGLGGIKESLKRLKRGEGVLLFPEGTRTRDGQLHAFHPGFTTLAVRSKVAIVPAAVDGAFAAWPRSQKLPRPGRVFVRYGQPIPPEEVCRLGDRALVEETHRRVEQCLQQIRAES